MPQIQIYPFLALGTQGTGSILVFKTRTWPPHVAGNSLLLCFELGATSCKGVSWRSPEKRSRNLQRKLVLYVHRSVVLWSVSPKDAVDAKTYVGSRWHWTRTWKRNPLRITDSINHVKLRKSPKNSWKLREYLGKYHLCFLVFDTL